MVNQAGLSIYAGSAVIALPPPEEDEGRNGLDDDDEDEEEGDLSKPSMLPNGIAALLPLLNARKPLYVFRPLLVALRHIKLSMQTRHAL